MKYISSVFSTTILVNKERRPKLRHNDPNQVGYVVSAPFIPEFYYAKYICIVKLYSLFVEFMNELRSDSVINLLFSGSYI